MIKTALKHWIYEKCIDIIFDNIFKNFKDPKKRLTNVIVGQRFNYILTSIISDPSDQTKFYDLVVADTFLDLGFVIEGFGYEEHPDGDTVRYSHIRYEDCLIYYQEVIDYEKA